MMKKMKNKDCLDALKRVVGLEKLAGLQDIGSVLYIGDKLESSAKANNDLLDAAYEANETYGSIENAIESTEKKKRAGEAVALIAAGLGVSQKIPLAKAIPLALSALIFGLSNKKDATSYKRLKGQQLILGDLKGL